MCVTLIKQAAIHTGSGVQHSNAALGTSFPGFIETCRAAEARLVKNQPDTGTGRSFIHSCLSFRSCAHTAAAAHGSFKAVPLILGWQDYVCRRGAVWVRDSGFGCERRCFCAAASLHRSSSLSVHWCPSSRFPLHHARFARKAFSVRSPDEIRSWMMGEACFHHSERLFVLGLMFRASLFPT